MNSDALPANTSSEPSSGSRNWRPLNPTQRRVAGVLVEKAKTTPEQYPLSLNALTNGCNQKNNRHPLTNLTQDQVEQSIDELREIGAAVEVQGSGRVPKYRHCFYEWLGVEKVELAVMAELLLRGEQTVGELRSRASRMEPIPDLGALRPVLESLKAKSLLLELSAEGRGQIVSHNLYKDREIAEIRARSALLAAELSSGVSDSPASDSPASDSPASSSSAGARSPARARALAGTVTLDMFNELQLEVAELRAEVGRLRGTVQQLTGS